MKFLPSLAFLALFIFTSCEIDEPPRRTTTTTTRTASRYPTPPPQYPAQPQPFDPAAQPPATTTDVPPTDPAAIAAETPATPPTTTGPAATAPKGDYPYGVPVPGKPGFVRSPYSPDKMTDVRGYAPGTEVKDPYTQKIFLVP